MTSPISNPVYQLTVDGLPDTSFDVRSFRGKEEISEAYHFDVDVTVEAGAEMGVERAALGQRAALTWTMGETKRAFYGLLAAVHVVGVHELNGHQATVFRMRLVPRLWLLKRTKRTRIFQKMRVPDIVTAVLAEAGIGVRWQLLRAYPPQEYCTQYEESDYRFILRLLAEAGIYFYFVEGPPVSAAVVDAASGAVGAVGAVGALVGDAVGGALGAAATAAGSIASSVAAAALPLVPGDTMVFGDDAASYPTIGADDAARLAAASGAALVPEIAEAASGLGAIGAAAAGVAGALIAGLTSDAAPPPLYFLKILGTTTSPYDKITRFELKNSVRANSAMFRSYDPERPQLRRDVLAFSSQPFPPTAAERAVAAASAVGAIASAAGGALGGITSTVANGVTAVANGVSAVMDAARPCARLELYDHHNDFLFPKWPFVGDAAPRILRQARRRASTAIGDSACPNLSPAHRFELRDHFVSRLDGAYAVTAVEHFGDMRGHEGSEIAYRNTFECVPSTVAYVPSMRKRKSVQVSLTATVVGPPGEEIHVDAMGQIKVQFHWDRSGRHDDRSSCWIRTMHAWGGAGWGAQFIPRVGMEVIVIFEGGDPDRPMVLGSVYNGTHPTPFLLPADKTRSGWRTQSSPNRSGFNELSFEDAAGKEQIFVHAQKDLDEKVGSNHTLLVRNDEILRILGSRLDTVERNLETLVKGDYATRVEGNRNDTVHGNAEEHVAGARLLRVDGTERIGIKGNSNLEYAADLTTHVRGCVTTIVGRADKKRAWVTHAEGTAALSGLDKLELASDKELVIRVGKSSIRITPDKIEIAAATISAKGGAAGLSVSDDGLSMASKGDAQMVVGKKLVIKTDSASLKMEKEVLIDGTKIHLNSPSLATDPPPKEPEPPTKIELTDMGGTPQPYQRFVAVLDDKSDISGMTDKDGKVELELKVGGKIRFLDLTMPDDQSGKGPTMPYVVRQGDYLSKLAFTYGFDADQVWSDSKNAELKKTRKSPNLLHPGDIVFFPRPKPDGLPLAKGTTNKYKVKVPTTTVRLTFKDGDGPFANEAYTIEGLGAAKAEGTTDGSGAVTLEVPIHVRGVHLTFPKRKLTFPIGVGDMDPIDEPLGIRKRLQHLGYGSPSDALSEEEQDARDRAATAAFQKANGLKPTGDMDDATKAALEKAHDA